MDLEGREDMRSILPFLPLILRGGELIWPPNALESLKALALGPDVSGVTSGEVLFDAVIDLRDGLDLAGSRLAPGAADGYAAFFDSLMSRKDSRIWFEEIVPSLSRLLLQLPSLLDEHYKTSDAGGEMVGLRLMDSQEAGLIFLSQKIVAALLTCALFCLFPSRNRNQRHLPIINFDCLFATVNSKRCQEHKLRCLIHYFERICSQTPTGFVSFERKVLPRHCSPLGLKYPEADIWSYSSAPLCPFEVLAWGLIEDDESECLEVDFANASLGGGALSWGCVQEEIRFMINPELIAGMLFMTGMEDNEAIEVIGVERFSKYNGYGSSFCFMGNYIDKKAFDSRGRRKTRIVAIDALYCPKMQQYGTTFLLREVNKAFCGFMLQSKCQLYANLFKNYKDSCNGVHNSSANPSLNNSVQITGPMEDCCGISTGNWGCGAFGGDPEVKSMIQWLAASQALRPFIHYYTFEEESLERLEEVSHWILRHEWKVGDLWSMLVEYSLQRLRKETSIGFFQWLLPAKASGESKEHYMSE